ncbi:armadillo-type protein [Zychaea mexicana]|uniref:armadillo-type protein n=1 Tax=Zychaea mexicana TaxID=64656 RepID=UPI0022FE2113|nr:armadillo-type protein [Zychaea mexicana]KAI9491520.1 armadillo-type protein [Zychaea mexicana]
MMDVDEPQQQVEQKPLKFKSRLVAKSIDAKELTSRLKTLHEELNAFGQHEIVKESLDATAKELVNSKILKHASGTVKAYAATCLADMLRLYAPEAPFSDKETNSIFQLFLSQLSQLKQSQDHPQFPLYFYLLESLSTVKSILIVADLDNAQQLSSDFFECFFSTIRSDMPRNIQVCMIDLMVQLIEDVGALSDETLALLLEQFKKSKDDPCYIMTFEACNACFDTLQRRVCQYFSDALIAMSHSDGSEEDTEELQKAHEIIQRVHAVVPNLLLNVLPQLEEEMKVDDYKVRCMATETIGDMFAEPNSTMFQRYPSIWKTWVGRRNDKSVQLRVKWLEKCKAIYQNHTQVKSELHDCFKEKIIDPDEKVRATACRVISELENTHVIRDLDKTVLELVAERSKDKKSSVRKEAMAALGKIYEAAYPQIDENAQVKEKLGWIPDALLKIMYTDDPSATATLESTVNQYLFPYNEDDKERTERLVFVIKSFEPRTKNAFRALIHKQRGCIAGIQRFIKACEPTEEQMDVDEEQGESDASQKLEAIVKHIAASFAEPARLSSALKRFAEVQADNKTLLELLETATDPNTEYKQIVEAKNSLEEKLSDLLPGSYETLEPLLVRACPIIINKNITPHLLKMLEPTRLRRRATENPNATVAQELLKEMATSFPTMYEDHVYELIRGITDTNTSLVNNALELLAQISKSKVTVNVHDNDILDKLASFITQGDLAQARNASIVLSNMYAFDICDDVIESALNNVSVKDPSLYLKLASIAEFALYVPERVGTHIQALADFIEHHLMGTSTEAENDSATDDDVVREWIAYEDLKELSKAKLAGLQLLVNYLLSSVQFGTDDMLVERVFNLLWNLLDTTCEMAIGKNQSAPESSHLRLAAAQSMVKLTHKPAYQNQLSVSQFEHLALTIQDTCYQVRYGFAETLMKGIPMNQVHMRYLSVLFLSAHEPEEELLKQVKYFIQKRSLKQYDNSVAMETSFVQLLHTLAHHPDFTVATEDLIVFTQYFEFYLSCVATPDNVSFLYHVAQKVKSSKDMVSNELSQNSYVLSDLASLLIKRKCEDASWPLNVYPTRIRLQSKLYRSLPSGAVQTETLKKSYLPAPFLNWLEENHHPHRKGEKRNSAASTSSSKRNRTN